MHEISLVQGLLAQLTNLANENHKTKIRSVTMQIGPLSGVVTDSFRFGFDVLSEKDSLTKGAYLIIQTAPVRYKCTKCGFSIVTEETKPDKCIKCDEIFLLAQGGDDLILEQVEME